MNAKKPGWIAAGLFLAASVQAATPEAAPAAAPAATSAAAPAIGRAVPSAAIPAAASATAPTAPRTAAPAAVSAAAPATASAGTQTAVRTAATAPTPAAVPPAGVATTAQPAASAATSAVAPSAQAAPRSAMPAVPAGPSNANEFQDCAVCPVMVKIPAGKFMMGSPVSERGRNPDEGPQNDVSIGYAFAAGKFEVTQAEYAAFVAATKAQPPVQPKFLTDPRHPVVNVSWDDAQAYVKWLSQTTGKQYRLLTEAEWEYAARAGSRGAFPWGEAAGSNNINCDGCGSVQGSKGTAPVGSFKPNAFGLYDMHGNVWEWVEDNYHENYKGAPTNGSAWSSKAPLRVLRGGSWYDKPDDARSAERTRHLPNVRAHFNGIRVARLLK